MEIPEPIHQLDAVMDDGAVIGIRQYGDPAGPRLVLSHGNGLAIDGYLPFWEPLCARYELILFDFRNHGRNPPHSFAHHNWPNFIRDLELVHRNVEAELGHKPTAGVFHSLSAVTATMHAHQYGPRFDPLVLFDPPFYPRDGHPLRDAHVSGEDGIAERAARRTASFADPLDLARQFQKYFPHWVPGAHELMARATLRRDDATGRWTLACPREYEAHIFRTNRETTGWTALGRIPAAVKLICADPKFGDGPALVGKAISAEAPVEYEFIPGATHFLQIEQPAACIRAMESFLAARGFIA